MPEQDILQRIQVCNLAKWKDESARATRHVDSNFGIARGGTTTRPRAFVELAIEPERPTHALGFPTSLLCISPSANITERLSLYDLTDSFLFETSVPIPYNFSTAPGVMEHILNPAVSSALGLMAPSATLTLWFLSRGSVFTPRALGEALIQSSCRSLLRRGHIRKLGSHLLPDSTLKCLLSFSEETEYISRILVLTSASVSVDWSDYQAVRFGILVASQMRQWRALHPPGMVRLFLNMLHARKDRSYTQHADALFSSSLSYHV